MSLYQQYRPQNFADVYGQDHIVQTLENAIKQDKLAHAYLFAGTRGTGKTTTARLLAKSIMTRGIEDEVIKKQIITGIENGSLVDLIEIDGASNRNIDDIRELKEKIQFSPVVASAKVYIIDEVHMFTKEAFNALLKTLEEPPTYAYFILATTELHKIPATIQSRCQTYPFRRIDTEDIIRRLQYVADTEKIIIDREAVRAIAQHAQGGMRDALSLLDQLQSIESISVADVESRTGASGQGVVEEIWQLLETKDVHTIVQKIRAIEQDGTPLESLVRQLLQVGRTKMHVQLAQNEQTNETLTIIQALLEAVQNMRHQPIAGLALEASLLEAFSDSTVQTPAKAATPNTPVTPKPAPAKEPEQKKSTPITEATPAANNANQVTSEAEAPATFEQGDLNLASIQLVWLDVIKKVQPASAQMSLKDASLGNVHDNTLELHFNSSFHKDKVEAAGHSVEQELQAALKQPVKIQCTIQTGPAVSSVADSSMVNLADAASEIF